MSKHINRRQLSHRLFLIGTWLKGLDGVLELIGGVLFLLMSKSNLNHIVVSLTQHELTEDPHDLIANMLRHAVSHLSHNTKIFGSIYLLAHGMIKIFLVAGLLQNKYFVYPIALVVLSGFIVYQSYRLIIGFTLFLCLLTILDFIIVLLIWNEFRHISQELPVGS